MIRALTYAFLLIASVSAHAEDEWTYDWEPYENVSGYVGYAFARHEGIEVGIPYAFTHENMSLVLNPISGLLWSNDPWTTAPEWYDCHGFPLRTKAADGSAYFDCIPISKFDYAPTVEARYLFGNIVSFGIGSRGGYGATIYGLIELRHIDEYIYAVRIGRGYTSFSVGVGF